jgi:hypothetical protein
MIICPTQTAKAPWYSPIPRGGPPTIRRSEHTKARRTGQAHIREEERKVEREGAKEGFAGLILPGCEGRTK